VEPVKMAVIYYSATGTNYRLALEAEKTGREAGAQVRLRKVAEHAPESAIAGNSAWKAHVDATRDVPLASLEDLEWADALVICSPTRYGGLAAQMKQFLDRTGPLWAKGKLANKTVTAMTSAGNDHGGQEATILSLYTVMYHWGTIVVAPGYTDPAVFAAGGNPYGTSVTQRADGVIEEETLAAAACQTRRLLAVTAWLKAGQTAVSK
jgi:NAD(P)H dehydrogenase (quinone)